MAYVVPMMHMAVFYKIVKNGLDFEIKLSLFNFLKTKSRLLFKDPVRTAQ
jgi:hypothetical protein